MYDFFTRMCKNICTMGKLLAVDLDGTLLYPKQLFRCISRRNCKFLQNWYDQGNRIVLITSRSASFIERLKKEIQRPFDYIAVGSAQISVDGNLIRDVAMDNNAIIEILDTINKQYKPVAFLMTAKGLPMLIRNNKVGSIFLLAFYKLYWIFQFKYREAFVLDTPNFDKHAKDAHIYKIMVFYGFRRKFKEIAKDVNKYLREKYPEIEASWSYIVNEITPQNCHKGEGLSIYCDYLNIKKEDVYAVGDSGNDIEMFNRFYENSYCMKHGGKVVRKYAKHTIRRVYDLNKLVLKGENNE